MKIKFYLNKEFKKIAKRYNLSLILAFGSYVTNKIHPNSDLDIAVLSKKDFNDYKEYCDLLSNLSKLFPEKEIDLVFINHADPLLLKKILESCQLLYGSKKELAKLKMYSFKKYCDYRRYLDLERRFVHKFVKEFK